MTGVPCADVLPARQRRHRMWRTPDDFPSRYREGSIAGLLPSSARQELFIRSRPAEMSGLLEQYFDAAEKAGDPIRKFTQKGSSHFDAINPRAPDWESVMASVRSLLGNP